VLKRKNARPKLSPWDKVLWVFLRRVWSRWTEGLVVVKPKTVVRWHRAGFRLYWCFLSRTRADPGLAPSFFNSFSAWRRRIPSGESPESMESY
jgi:hypothetical protein